MSEKKATRDDWKCRPFEKYEKIDYDIALMAERFVALEKGYIPESMEEYWIIYCDDDTINFVRSWTGIQIFRGHFRKENGGYVIYAVDVNNDKNEYSSARLDDLSTFEEVVKG